VSIFRLITKIEGADIEIVPSPFIVGVPRSGTTLLRAMLDAHPDLAVAPETHYIPEIVRACEQSATPRATFLEALLSNQRWQKQRVSGELLRHRVKGLGAFDLGGAFRQSYMLYAERYGKPRWGEKTPSYLLHMGLIQRLLPEAHFIHIIRDGRDVALSIKDLWFGPNTVEEAAEWWVNRIRSAQRQSKGLANYMEIRYEDLVLDTEPTVRAVCDFLALPYDSAVLNYHEKSAGRPGKEEPRAGGPIHTLLAQPPQPSRTCRWKTEMGVAAREYFESVAGEVLQEFGYEIGAAHGR